MATTLELTLLYLVAAVLGVVIFRTLKLPPMLGYLVVGVVIGPHALAFAQDSAGVRYLAEFGVVFLMFVIGLEFNLPKLRSMRTLVFGLGMSQVVLTVLGTLAGHLLLVWVWNALSSRPWEMGWQGAVVLGSAMAMSSTAIVAKLLAERLELEAEHGRRIMGVLLFQDLAVVPLLVLIPALGSSAEELATEMGWALLRAAALLTVLLVGGQRVMRWWLTQVARRKSEELFVLNLLLITLGLAWVTEHFGLSLALGAFVAGMLVGPDDRGVDDQVLKVRIVRERFEDPPPHPLGAPPTEAAKDAVPVPERLVQITPRRARPDDPQHPFDKHPVVPARRALLVRPPNDQRRNPLPLFILQNQTIHHTQDRLPKSSLES